MNEKTMRAIDRAWARARKESKPRAITDIAEIKKLEKGIEIATSVPKNNTSAKLLAAGPGSRAPLPPGHRVVDAWVLYHDGLVGSGTYVRRPLPNAQPDGHGKLKSWAGSLQTVYKAEAVFYMEYGSPVFLKTRKVSIHALVDIDWATKEYGDHFKDLVTTPQFSNLYNPPPGHSRHLWGLYLDAANTGPVAIFVRKYVLGPKHSNGFGESAVSLCLRALAVFYIDSGGHVVFTKSKMLKCNITVRLERAIDEYGDHFSDLVEARIKGTEGPDL